ncbi:HAMP domain-containing protein [Ktedonobacter sp. SOSP1-52]|uniref:HAMP domain-containing protein n=1 Tax=Ktedonobacter sp. SOSP1-52 TaxID=2778366 RepID=UPI0019165C5A|nr:HAMP domain-containing protein [Ktedonobacter sp. SOSP1-52]
MSLIRPQTRNISPVSDGLARNTRTPLANLSQTPSNTTIHIRPRMRGGRTLVLDMPIGQRLAIGFLLAAVIAALVAGLVGAQRSASLGRQSEFYQDLLRTNTSLTTGANFLQLMNTETATLISDAGAASPSKETIKQDETALRGLITRYDTTLKNYVGQDLVSKHPTQVAMLEEASNGGQVHQQETLAASAQRTWLVYKASLEQVLSSVDAHNLTEAANFERVQAEPTNGDALSALRALIQLNQRLSNSINIAAGVEEQQQLLTTIIGSILAFIAIALVGWFISGTIVQRLKQLLRVTQSVEGGDISARVDVVGRDEISSVSASTNAMLDAIVALLEETQRQNVALTNAAEHLFSTMRVVNAGDLRVSTNVNSDPIDLLANAFNFTVGRFRRFVTRIQTVIDQLDSASRYEVERAEHFLSILNTLESGKPVSRLKPARLQGDEKAEAASLDVESVATQLKQTRERLHNLSDESAQKRLLAMQSLNEQIIQVTDRLQKGLTRDSTVRGGSALGNGVASMYLQELRTLETQAQRMCRDAQQTQWQLTQNLVEVEKELTKLTNATQVLGKQGSVSGSLSAETREELYRSGSVFVGDVLSMARKLNALSQEIRVNMISFQLEGNDEVGYRVRPISDGERMLSQASPEYNFSVRPGGHSASSDRRLHSSQG